MKRISLVIVAILIGHLAFSQNLFRSELNLPAKGLSQRVTQRIRIPAEDKIVLFDETGPGCIFHWWMTYSPRADQRRENREFDIPHYLRVKIYYNESTVPDVDVTLAQFFSLLQGKDIYTIDNAAIKILPRNALNCYFPIPFEKCRIELENTGKVEPMIWSMFDWQEYPEHDITPYRFNVIYQGEFPADSAGSILMADISGEGFIAGMTKSVVRKDHTDAWYHSGGDLALIDGESVPRAMRGIGGEDVFNMSFGVWDVQTDWVGTPVRSDDPYERVMYRIFGPSPIWYNTSFILRFGTKANDIETIVYTYVDKQEAREVITPQSWKLAGPFKCDDYVDFDKKEWADKSLDKWPASHIADFDPYICNLHGLPNEAYTFKVPIIIDSEHGWCDFASSYRGKQRTNQGAQPEKVSAYAIGSIDVAKPGKYKLLLGFDDWIKVWVNDHLVYTGKHEQGFDNASIDVELPASTVEIKLKLSNQNNYQWRLWSFNVRLEQVESQD